MPNEFICRGCGRQIFAFGDRPQAEVEICAHCETLPGWFEDPRLRAVLDPTWIDSASPARRSDGERGEPSERVA